MEISLLSEFAVGDLVVRYVTDRASGRVGVQLLPSERIGRLARPRQNLAGVPEVDALPAEMRPRQASGLDPLVHVKFVGDPLPGGFAAGHTLRNSPSIARFRYEAQRVQQTGTETRVITTLLDPLGLRLEHQLSWHDGDKAVTIQTRLINGSDKPAVVELLTSFSLSGLTAFDSADASGRLRVHRFRSAWSAEARLDSQTIEALHLERSWIGVSLLSERFGQVGSMPVRRWFPFAAVEDTVEGVIWAAQLAWAGSWQMEISRQTDDVSLSGGLADYDFGHWRATVTPGESLDSPPAMLTCVVGDIEDACARLTALQHRAADAHPERERDLPVVFNEWCTTWGEPRHDRVAEIARRLSGTGVSYFVIDAGWYRSENTAWHRAHGDWRPSAGLFPHGLKAAAEAIRAQGLIPGPWFEMETVGDQSAAFSLTDHLLRRDGAPLTVGLRRFWDLNDPFVIDYLTERVIHTLADAGFGYLKVDYNETIGPGCDHPDGLGEGLRRQTLGTYRFFERIRERLPGLIIENCASGGHRLEPSMIARTSMSSFSDAHETREIPIIAARLQRLILPRQSQVWAVLRQADSLRRLTYSLAATFLGRMCLSGEVAELNEAQWQVVRHAIALYRSAAPVIRRGVSRLTDRIGESWRRPSGHQVVVRHGAECGRVLVVLHAFEATPTRIESPLPEGRWAVEASLTGDAVDVQRGRLVWTPPGEFSGEVVLLRSTDR